MLGEISQSVKNKYHMISLMWNLKNNIIKQTNQNQTHRNRELPDGCQRVGGIGELSKNGKRIKEYKWIVKNSHKDIK